MAKIVLDKIPEDKFECPLWSIICSESKCFCTEKYDDEDIRDFFKCPYCITINDVTPCV
jgi:hypothetical protein